MSRIKVLATVNTAGLLAREQAEIEHTELVDELLQMEYLVELRPKTHAIQERGRSKSSP